MEKAITTTEKQLQFPPAKYKLVTPAAVIGKTNQYIKRSFILVQFDTGPESPDVYQLHGDWQGISNVEHFALTKNGLKKISDALGINWSSFRSDNRTNPELAEVVAKGKFLGIDGEVEIVGIKAIEVGPAIEELRLDLIDKAKSGLLYNPRQTTKKVLSYVSKACGEEIERRCQRRRLNLLKNKVALAETGAKQRAMRSLCAVQDSYTAAELKKTFVIPHFQLNTGKILKDQQLSGDALDLLTKNAISNLFNK